MQVLGPEGQRIIPNLCSLKMTCNPFNDEGHNLDGLQTRQNRILEMTKRLNVRVT